MVTSLEVLASEVNGPRAPEAWRGLLRAAQELDHPARRRDPSAYARSVLALRPWWPRTLDPAGDALLHSALRLATERGLPERGSLALGVASRATMRGDLGTIPALLKRAKAAGAEGPGFELLDAHVAIRLGRQNEATTRLRTQVPPDPALRLQLAFLLLSAGRFEDATSLLLEVRRTATGLPLLFGSASFFLAEASVRRGAWSEVLAHTDDASRSLGFVGPQGCTCTLDSWRARALRHLGRPDLARSRARGAFERGLNHGMGEAMLESAIELAHVSQGHERERWRREVQDLLPSSPRPEIHALAETLLDEDPAGGPVEIDRRGRWLRASGGRVDLRRRTALRQIIEALAHAQGGSRLGVDALFEAGWPGERIRVQSRHARVHTAIWQLRRLGVGDLLDRNADGYALAPRVAVVG